MPRSVHVRKALAAGLASATALTAPGVVPAAQAQPQAPQPFLSPNTLKLLRQHLPKHVVDDIVDIYSTPPDSLPNVSPATRANLARQLAHITHLLQSLLVILDSSGFTPVVDPSQQLSKEVDRYQNTLSSGRHHITPDTPGHHTVQSLLEDAKVQEFMNQNPVLTDPSISQGKPTTIDVDETDEVEEEPVPGDTFDSGTLDDDSLVQDTRDDSDIDDILATPPSDGIDTVSSGDLVIDTSIGTDALIQVINAVPPTTVLGVARELSSTCQNPQLASSIMRTGNIIVKSREHVTKLLKRAPTVILTADEQSLVETTRAIATVLVNGESPSAIPKPRVSMSVAGSRSEITVPDLPEVPVPSTKPSKGRLPDVSSATATANARVLKATQRAKSQLGVMYAWGGGVRGIAPDGKPEYYPSQATDGSGYTGFDCSGLVVHAFYRVLRNDRSVFQTGDPDSDYIRLPRWSGDQYSYGGLHVPVSDIKPGDLLFWGPGGSQHVAMYLGDGMMVEAYSTGYPIRIAPVRYSGMTDFAVRVIQ